MRLRSRRPTGSRSHRRSAAGVNEYGDREDIDHHRSINLISIGPPLVISGNLRQGGTREKHQRGDRKLLDVEFGEIRRQFAKPTEAGKNRANRDSVEIEITQRRPGFRFELVDAGCLVCAAEVDDGSGFSHRLGGGRNGSDRSRTAWASLFGKCTPQISQLTIAPASFTCGRRDCIRSL